ncbi:hypothetical protein E2320_008258, partial [Naja naja]
MGKLDFLALRDQRAILASEVLLVHQTIADLCSDALLKKRDVPNNFTGSDSVPASQDPKLQKDLKKLQCRLDRMEKALTLEGKIAIVGDKLFASTGKTSVFEKTEVTCQEAHGSIAAPRNLNENKAIQKIVQYYNSYAYLGIMESDEPGKFHFRNGDPLNFTNWYKNEPSSQGVEKCVEMYNDGTWNDKMCNNYRLELGKVLFLLSSLNGNRKKTLLEWIQTPFFYLKGETGGQK